MSTVRQTEAITVRHRSLRRSWQELKIDSNKYKLRDVHHFQIAPSFEEGEKVHLNRPPLFRSGTEKAAAERYIKWQTRKQKPYRGLRVKDNTLQLLQDG